MKKWHVIGLLVIVVLLSVIPLMTIRNSEFGGADGLAEEAIMASNPDYVPWVESLIELPGGETESFLFSLQAALGAGIFAYGLGYLNGKNKSSHKEKLQE